MGTQPMYLGLTDRRRGETGSADPSLRDRSSAALIRSRS
jgi:hypothetical protein